MTNVISSLPFTLTNGTIADASQVMANLQQITGDVNGKVGLQTGTGSFVLNNSPSFITPALGTPSALVGTHITGTGAGFTAGAVTNGIYRTDTGTVTNTMLANSGININGVSAALGSTVSIPSGNLTGPITSVGNATSIASSIALPGSPTTTTQSAGDNSTKIATTAYADAAGSYLKVKTMTLSGDTTFTLPANCTIVSTIATLSGGVVLNPIYSGDSATLYITNAYNDVVINGNAFNAQISQGSVVGDVRSNWVTDFTAVNIPTTCTIHLFDSNTNDYIPWYTAVVNIVLFYCVI